jgi:diguanylate cyclase (GGDEF)-like protein
VRAITARHEREHQLTQLAKFDALTGEMNRVHLTEVLGAKLDEAVRFRHSLGFLLVAIDHLANLNESYGFDVAEDVIAQVAKRIRARLRGKDYLGRFSGNKFGIILTNCTPRAGRAACRASQASRLVRRLSAERGARCATPRQRARDRRDRGRAQRTADRARL